MKTWLITGCSSGLGKSLAWAALKRGDRVAVTARSTEALNEFSQAFPETALILPLDVTDPEAVQRRIGKDLSHGTQPGDPDKDAELIISAIESEHPSFRLLLGSDAVAFAEKTLAHRQEEYAQWREFSRCSDFT